MTELTKLEEFVIKVCTFVDREGFIELVEEYQLEDRLQKGL